jgi:membrane-bound metal-dependent hydrolase YbcI (DUF457 family)
MVYIVERMANSKKHLVVAATACGGANLLCQLYNILNSPNPPSGFWDTINRIDFLEIAAFAGIGGAIGLFPDLIEPATSPNHRAFFHSLAFSGVVTYAAFGKHSENWSTEDKIAARIALLSYLSHLALDAGTPKSLPLI